MTDVVRKAARALAFLLTCICAVFIAAAANPPQGATPAPKSPTVAGQSATLLPDGRWLLLGGRAEGATASSRAVVVDHAARRTTLPQRLNVPRSGHTATVLPDGSVLIVGGVSRTGQPVAQLERFDAQSGLFENLGDPGLGARSGHTATLLTDGRVLIAGGTDVSSLVQDDVVLLDPTTLQPDSAAATLSAPRTGQTARLLPSGDVLISGGRDQGGETLSSSELYRAKSNTVVTLTPAEVQALVTQSAGASAPTVQEALPQADKSDVAVGSRLVLRFSKPLAPESLSGDSVTLFGPNGAVDVRVVAAEGGSLAFVTPRQQMLPGTRYTLFVRGAKDRVHQALPFTAIGFDTESLQAANPAGSVPPLATRLPLLNDADGEIWIPAKRNLTGVWRRGGAAEARRHLPNRRSVARELYNKHGKDTLPEAPPGVTAVAGQVLRLNGGPLADVALSIGSRRVLTDRNGEFLLTQVPAGVQTLVIDGTSANAGPRQYGRFEYRATVEAGKTNALPFVIWMTRLDTNNVVRVPSPTTSETVVSNPRIPGLELRIPAGTVIRDSEGRNVTDITLTAIPVDQPPFPLPNRHVPVYFTIQPGGAHLQGLTVQSAKGARLIYPNFTQSPAGSRIDFWNYDPRQKGWYVYGQGTVSTDGKQVEPDAGVVIYEFTGAMIALPSTAPNEGPPSGGCQSGAANATEAGGDPVDCFTGLFLHKRVDLVVADVLPLEVRRVYRPRDNTSRAFGIGTNLGYDLFLVGDTIPWTYQDLILPDGGRVHFTRTSSGTEYRDAVYTTTTPGAFHGSVIRWNAAIDSGWTLTFKDGAVYTFADAFQSASARCSAVAGMKDRFGNALTLARDSNCNLTSITSPNDRKLTFTYDTSNRITQVADDIGRTVTYQYDTSGRLTSATNAAGDAETYTYDTSNRMLTVTDWRGNLMVTNTYDANGRVSLQTYGDSTTTSFNYTLNGSGAVTRTDYTNERGAIKRVVFGGGGLPTSVTYALGQAEEQVITFTRDPTSNLAQTVTDELGRVTRYQYDSKGNTTQITRLYGTSDATSWSFTYEPTYSLLATATDPLSRTVTYTYDTQGNLSSVTDSAGNVTSLAHNAAGLVTSSTRYLSSVPRTFVATYQGGDLASVADSLGRTTRFFRDAVGRVRSVKNAAGSFAHFVYDDLDRVVRTTDPMGRTIELTYDENGNLLTFEDPRGNVTTFTYDLRNRLLTMADPLTQTVSYVYDAIGNRVRVTDRNGVVTGYTYDLQNRVTNAGFGATPSNPTAYTSSVAFTWDASDRLLSAADSASGTISQTHDGLDRLTQQQTPQGTIDYTYYASGLRQSMTVQGQSAVNYTYDSGNRLTQISQGSTTVGFTYDTLNRRSTLTLPNGVIVSYGYDAGGQLTQLSYQNGSTSLGNLTYTYDALGRRTSAGGSLAQTSLPAPISSAVYDAANRLTNWDGTALTYDNEGNMLAHGARTYGWNARNQLVSTSEGSGTFAYDAFGRRTTRTVSSATTTYQHDGLNPVKANGDFLLSGGLDEIFARINSSNTRSFLRDGLGSTLALTDGAGATTASFTYEPYGLSTRAGSEDTSFRYTGREDDGASKLQYNRARYYSPELGRFISSDPIGLAGGSNTYAYASGSPTNATDPLGLWDSVTWTCARDPAFCQEIMGQIVRNAGAASGNPCLEEAANAVADAMDTVGDVLDIATSVRPRPSAARSGAASPPPEPPKMAATANRATTDVVARPDGLVNVRQTIDRIKAGGTHPHRNDGTVFKNKEGVLPAKPPGYYREYVHPTPGVSHAGLQRIIQGQNGELYYSPDHYKTIVPLN